MCKGFLRYFVYILVYLENEFLEFKVIFSVVNIWMNDDKLKGKEFKWMLLYLIFEILKLNI